MSAVDEADIKRFAEIYRAAVESGAQPKGATFGVGRRSALWDACEKGGWSRNEGNYRLDRALRAGLLDGLRVEVSSIEAFTVQELPSAEGPIEDLIDRMAVQFQRQKVAREARTLIQVQVNIEGAYGICHMGDPHLDDNGCDWTTLRRHIEVIKRTEGLFGANVGDYQNGWIGRLARLWANQSTSSRDAQRLVEWFVNEVRWLYLVGGNHDAYCGVNDPVKWFAGQVGALYEPHGLRLNLAQSDGSSVRVHARHNFSGTSMWNPTHGAAKKARFAWERDHIYTCGHLHHAGHQEVLFDDGPDQFIAHAIRLGSYKVYDDHADANGFDGVNIPAAVTVVNPTAKTQAGRVSFFWEPEAAADYLTFLRRPKFRVKAATS
jgi:hypothetical protein